MSTLEYRSVESEPGDASWWSWIGWAIYLGMSWTWCVGMFLPVLLVRDYGFWGWVVFAIPNVIGAAAVGWINRTAEQSKQTVAAHRLAMIAFSLVTATYQIFFLFWFIGGFEGDKKVATLMVGLALFGIAPIQETRAERIVAVLVFGVSIACIIECFHSGQMSIGPMQMPTYGKGDAELLPLAASTCFGFLTCPHMDLTFHHARQQLTITGSRIAFGLGLGLVFAALIFWSLIYSGQVIGEMLDRTRGHELFDWALSIYLAIQLAFTIGVHWNAAVPLNKAKSLKFVLGTTVVGITIALFADRIGTKYPQVPGEFVYRLFLGFYGLIFPAYVWLCMLPGRWIVQPFSGQWIVFIAAVAVALPCVWMGFIEMKIWWVVPGIAIPLAARFFIRSPVQQ